MTSVRRHLAALAAFALTAMILPLSATSVAAESGATVPAGFRDEVVWSGLPDNPMAISFAPSGKVFVALKGGSIYEFDSLADPSPTLIVNLATEVHNYWDRGLMGMVVDPQFPTRPYVYALYAYDHQLGGPAGPKWGDMCPGNPGGNLDGCVISGKLVRLTTNAAGTSVIATTPLIEDWCQQFPSHSLGSLAFGPEGALYVTGGDGASFNGPDYGQLGGSTIAGQPSVTPVNPCGDPLNEGGALRSQDIRSTGDPTGLNGALLRIDPDTGAAWPSNANFGIGDANAQRIIAYGLRNPYRMTIRPGDGSVWVGDVGFNTTEEINTVPNPNATARNFGWPCKEGSVTTPEYVNVITSVPLTLCTSLGSAWTQPAFQYAHSASVAAGDGCGTGSSAVAGVAFRTTAGNYPSAYDNGLFFTDYTRRCIWFVPAASATAAPDFTQVKVFANLRRSGDMSGGSVFVGTTPAGDIIYADYDRKEVRAVHYDPALPPDASFTATPSTGNAPLHVDFDASGSSDPNGDPLTYAWDLDGDGQYDDATGVTPSHVFSDVGDVTVGLKVTDTDGMTDTASKIVHAGNSAPDVDITVTLPDGAATWAVGDPIHFEGTATDLQDGPMPATSFDWTLAIEHCPSDCHEHLVDHFDAADPASDFDGTDHGDVAAPDHDYPSYVRLYLTVTDSDGLSTTAHVDLQPKSGTVDAVSSPAGITLGVASGSGAPPPAVTAIAGSMGVTVTAPSTATLGEDTYTFHDWSDGGDRIHHADVHEGANHLTATYTKTGTTDTSNTCSGAPTVSPSGAWRAGRLGTATDIDWYKFSLTSTGVVRIVLGNLPEDASLSLYSGCTKLLSTSDRGGNATEEIFKSLAKGSYAVKVTTKGVASPDSYALSIRRMPAGLALISSSTRVSGSSLITVGEVYNGTTASQGPSMITVKLYNAAGRLLATRTGRTDIYVPRGARAPFRIVGSVPAGYSKAVVTVRAVSTHAVLTTLTYSGLTAAYDASRYRMQGTVWSSVAISSFRVMLTSYNRVGTVVDVTRAVRGATTLAAGRSTSFDAWSSYTGTIDKASLRAVGVRK